MNGNTKMCGQFLRKAVAKPDFFVCGRCGLCRCSALLDDDEISAPQVGCVEMSRGLNCIHGNIETSLVFSFILNRQSDLAFLSRLPPTVSRRGESKVRFFFLRGISSTEASPLLEAALIGFPYKYQSRQLGFSSVFPCAFVRLTQYEKETIKSSEMEEGAGRASRLQMLPFAGYCKLTVLYRDGPSEDFPTVPEMLCCHRS